MPREKAPFILDRVPVQCNEGPFWGNGTIGSLLTIKDHTLRLTLDHTALWETRASLPDEPAAMFADIASHIEEFKRGDPNYVTGRRENATEPLIYRTKLPGLCLTIDLPSGVSEFCCATDLTKAKSRVDIRLSVGFAVVAEIFLNSVVNVLDIRVNNSDFDLDIIRAEGWDLSNPRLTRLKEWGYEKGKAERSGGILTAIQPFAGGERTAVTQTKIIRRHGETRLLATIWAGRAVEADEKRGCGAALLEDYAADIESYRERHEESWREFWDVCDVTTPTARLNDAFDLEMYKMFCNERPDGAAVTLQGVWNAHDRMPAWYGDLHNDLNVQACYWPAFKTGHATLADAYLRAYKSAAPRLSERAKKLFGVDGAIHIPVMMSPDGYAASVEWCFWNVLLGPELFVAVDFCWYYEFTRDEAALRDTVYPMIQGVARLYKGVVKEGSDGLLHIPFTQSPEYSDENGMVIRDDSTFALSALAYVLDKLDEYGRVLNADASEWSDMRLRLAKPDVGANGYNLFPGVPLAHSHRHFCHMYPIFPLGLTGHESVSRKTLEAAVNQGFTQFAAFSMPYLAIFAARHGLGNMCRTMLEIYCMVFRSRNSFVVNGDPYRNGVLHVQDTNAGESDDAFTLESGLIVPAALCDMMAHRSGGALWLMFGIPDDWKTCEAYGVTVEGGHKVAVKWDGYAFSRAIITPNIDENITVVLPRRTGGVSVSGATYEACPVPGDEKDCQAFRIAMKAGEDVTLERTR
ncbi:MAG: hypothetical protein LBK46_02525 [Oscillospiraceae bacterium]|jgi:hypothetical protein|nr:hypothetical protein [Oscillospiraceae bacterium]